MSVITPERLEELAWLAYFEVADALDRPQPPHDV